MRDVKLKTFEFTIPVRGDGLVRIEAVDLASALQRLLLEKPPFDDTIFYSIDWTEAELVERLDE